MSIFTKAALISTVLLAQPVAVAFAQSSDPAWLDDLTLQLKSEKACAVTSILAMREGQIGANNYYEARVQCSDGRMFDASRTEPEKTFTINACGVAVC